MIDWTDTACEIVSLANSVTFTVLYDLTFKIDLGLYSRLALKRKEEKEMELCQLLNNKY